MKSGADGSDKGQPGQRAGLDDLSFPEPFTDQVACPLCHGSGWIDKGARLVTGADGRHSSASHSVTCHFCSATGRTYRWKVAELEKEKLLREQERYRGLDGLAERFRDTYEDWFEWGEKFHGLPQAFLFGLGLVAFATLFLSPTWAALGVIVLLVGLAVVGNRILKRGGGFVYLVAALAILLAVLFLSVQLFIHFWALKQGSLPG